MKDDSYKAINTEGYFSDWSYCPLRFTANKAASVFGRVEISIS
uniref:Uncharacterized protein n=1 Tax=Utricularia reniformis TaxID=192314 RepID=A0A1Y0B319_9LAMI|nr:hypothetical protein AEK19_MT1602 [Utricularia reniformis]ART31784.1 hypothetical protein AEK19_MT1602 [Utricularia reniformis]